VKLHFPRPETSGRMGQAFLEFNSSADRRRAHTKNETYVADCQLQLHYSSQHSLQESVSSGQFSTYEMTSYQMQKRVISSRVHSLPMMMPSRGPPDTLRGHGASYPDGPMMGQGPPPPSMIPEGGMYGVFPGALFVGLPHRGQTGASPGHAGSQAHWDQQANSKHPMDAGQTSQQRANLANQAAAMVANYRDIMGPMAGKAPNSAKGSVASKTGNASATKASSAKANSGNGKAPIREEHKMKVAPSSKNVTATQETHQHPAPSPQVMSVSQRDTSASKSSAHSQMVAQLPHKGAQHSSFNKQGGWLAVPISNQCPENDKLLFTDTEEKELTGLLKFLARRNTDFKGTKEVSLQIEVCADDLNSHTPLFSQQTFSDLQSFQVWSKSFSL